MSSRDDEALMDEVRAAFLIFDPVPEAVLASGRAAFAWREPDAAQARLVADSTAAAGIRGASRLLTFDGTDLTVQIEVNGRGPDRELVGRLSPPAPAHVRIRHLGGELTARVDPAGHFIAAGVPTGLVSLVFRLPNATSIVTSWVRI
jgi:hypothetical protein